MPKGVKRLILSAGLGLLGFVFSSLTWHVSIPPSNVGQYLSFGLFLVAFTRTVKDTTTAAQLLAWFSIGQVLYFLIARPDNTVDSFENLWKYGIAYPVATIAVYVCVTSARLRPLLLPILSAIGVASIFLDYRSMGLVCLLTVVICYVQGQSKRVGKASGRPLRLIVGGIVVVALAELLPRAMEQGFFGESIQRRLLRQTADNTPAILGGRTESPLSIAAIISRPWIGWGDAQTIDQDTVTLGVRIADSLGLSNPSFFLPIWIRAEGRISLHSIFFTAWVEGGVLSAILPGALIIVFVVAIFRARGKLMPIVVFAAAHGIWDLLFSPWAGNASIAIAGYTILALWAIAESSAARLASNDVDSRMVDGDEAASFDSRKAQRNFVKKSSIGNFIRLRR